MKNVLIFCGDQMRADFLGSAGRFPVSTPHLDKLAAEGVNFTRYYCAHPICMPARLSMFTGLLPRDHGARINGQERYQQHPLLPQILSRAGYHCHAAGKLHLSPWVSKAEPHNCDAFPEDLEFWQQGLHTTLPVGYAGFASSDVVIGHSSYAHGSYRDWLHKRGGDPTLLTRAKALSSDGPERYEMAMPEEIHYNRYIADSTIAAMQRARTAATPHFLWCSFPDPHLPIAPPAPYYNHYKPEDMPTPLRREDELVDMPDFFNDLASGNLTRSSLITSTS